MRWALFLALACGCGDLQGFDQLLAEPACAEWDAWCRGQDLGTRVAQGARLDLRLGSRTTLTSGENVVLASSDPAIFTIDERTIVGAGPGTAVLLFRDSEGRLLDYTHVTVEAVVDIALYREGADEPEPFPSSLVLDEGDSVRIRAIPRGASGPLLGDIDTVFTIAGDDVDAISLSEGVRGIERVMAAAQVGSAVLEVQQGAFTDSLGVRVQ